LLLYFGMGETTQAIMASRKAAVSVRVLADLVAQTTASTTSPITDATMGSMFNAVYATMQPFTTVNTALSIDVAAISFTQFAADPSTISGQPQVAKNLVWVPTQNALASSFTPTATDPGYSAKVRWAVSPSSLAAGSSTLTTASVSSALARACPATGTTKFALTPQSSTSATPAAGELQTGLYGSGSVIVADISYIYTPTFNISVVGWGNNASWSTSTGMTTKNTSYMQPRSAGVACSGNSADTWICYTAQTASNCAASGTNGY